VLNHRNESLRAFLLGDYFFGATGAGSPLINGYYVDDDWSSKGPSEMDADSVAKMGMSPADVTAMIAAWQANQAAWRAALVEAQKWEWFLFYGGQQTAPGQNQTCPQCSCQAYLEAECGPAAGSQNGTLFYGFSRSEHSKPWPLPTPEQDIAMFLLSRGPYAYFGYGWSGCISAAAPFTRPALLDIDVGEPLGFCAETAPQSGVWRREYTKYSIQVDCGDFTSTFTPKAAPA